MGYLLSPTCLGILANFIPSVHLRSTCFQHHTLKISPPLSCPNPTLITLQCQTQLKWRNNRPKKLRTFNQATFPTANNNPSSNLTEIRNLRCVDFPYYESIGLLS